MAFESIPVENTIEILNVEPCDNPLISKCQIKVCYVQDEPNRNGSIITKEAAKKIAPSLRGTPIVGYYNENNEDFEAHNKIAIINFFIFLYLIRMVPLEANFIYDIKKRVIYSL